MYCEALRRDRTHEVAGSSPASSTKERPAKADLLSVLKTALFGEPAVAKLVKWTTFSHARTNCRLPMNDLPSLPCASIGNWTQATATVLACFRGFCASGICHPSPPVAATGLHKGSYSWYRSTSMTVSHRDSRFRSSFHGRRSPTSSGASRRGGASGSSEHISSSTIALWWLVSS